jgi:hypothetical protein
VETGKMKKKKMGSNIQLIHPSTSWPWWCFQASRCAEGERFYSSLTYAENLNYDYVATRRPPYRRQDTLISSSNIYNTSTVSFGENIRRVDYDSLAVLMKRNTSRFQGRNQG